MAVAPIHCRKTVMVNVRMSRTVPSAGVVSRWVMTSAITSPR